MLVLDIHALFELDMPYCNISIQVSTTQIEHIFYIY